MEAFQAHVKGIKVGNPFQEDTFQGPQVVSVHAILLFIGV